jgi:hypothetical protein
MVMDDDDGVNLEERRGARKDIFHCRLLCPFAFDPPVPIIMM